MSRDIKVSAVNQVLLGQQALQEYQVIMVLRVKRVYKVTLVLQVFQVQTAPQDQKDTQAAQGHPEKMVRMECQGSWDLLAPLVQQVRKGLRAIQAYLAHLAQQVSQLREFLVLMVHLEFLVPEVKMVSQVLPGLLVHLALQEK